MPRKPSLGTTCVGFALYSWLSSPSARLLRTAAAAGAGAFVADTTGRPRRSATSGPRQGYRRPPPTPPAALLAPRACARRLAQPAMSQSSAAAGGAASSPRNESATGEAAPPMVPAVSNRIAGTLDPCVVLMKSMVSEYSEAWRDRGGIYALSQGVVHWGPPGGCARMMREELSRPGNDLHQYGPDEGLPELRRELEAKLAGENGLTDHDVMVTAGANQAYVNCVLTLLGDRPGDEQSGGEPPQRQRAVVFAPYYFNHVMAIQMCAGPDCLRVGPCSDEGVPDLGWLERQLRDDPAIQMVTLVNPGNPTGVALDRAVLQRAVDLCRDRSCWLVLDCTYEHFVNLGAAATANEAARFDGCFGGEPHVIHIFSFSKSFALAGYRCGYLALPRGAPGLYGQMLKAQDTVPIAPSRISQVAALGALRAGRGWVAKRFATLDVGRGAILRALQPLKVMGGSGAMYFMAELPLRYKETDQDVARTLVRDYGVAVIPGSYCGFPGWIRVCYSNLPPDLCLQAADRLSQGIQSLVKGVE